MNSLKQAPHPLTTLTLRARLPLLALAVLAAAIASNQGPALAAGSTRPDTAGDVGFSSSLALDASGRPVVSYYDRTNRDLKVMHCNDANCFGGDESIASPDTAGDVGVSSSLALDASGRPVVSYHDSANSDLKVMHCNDVNCAGGDESIASPDTAGDVGAYTSLALDASGRPVVSYLDFTNLFTNVDLKVMHCNDANCAGGGESVTSPDTAGAVGQGTSLALDTSGRPVVSYTAVSADFDADLKVMHCNDLNCAGGDESIALPDTAGNVGWTSSLALDAAGRPVVSYHDSANSDLKVMHCNDVNCAAGGESITSPDTAGRVGSFSSLALDASARPVVSYCADSFPCDDLKVLHCNDANCAGGGESITSPDTEGLVGEFSSLALDATGRPVVSYSDDTNYDLKVMHCSDANCAVVKDSDGDLLPDPLEQGLRQCPRSNDADSDNDFLKDGLEAYIGSNICASDTDRDGLTDGAEAYISALRGSACPHLLDRDSDGDGWTDGQERNQDTNLCNRLSYPSLAAGTARNLAPNGFPLPDGDGDLLPDSVEATLRQCPGSNDADSDNDSLKDGLEAYIGSNICVNDTDRDGLADGVEIYVSALRHSPCPHLLDRDSDGDGWTDGRESNRGTNSCNRLSHP